MQTAIRLMRKSLSSKRFSFDPPRDPLRQHGHTVRKTIDCLIATFCLLQGHSLLHRDRDFDHFEKFLGLAVVHP